LQDKPRTVLDNFGFGAPKKDEVIMNENPSYNANIGQN